MTEQNKFTKVSTTPIYGDNIGTVSLYDASHANESEEQRIWTVTTIASLAYGNSEAAKPEALYERMKSIKHESLWEMCRPCFTGYGIEDSLRNAKNDILWYAKQVPYMLEQHKENIACFRIKVPMFVRTQFMRHRSFSYLEMSRRYTKGAKVPFEFWFPNDFNWQFNTFNDYAESYRQDFKTMMGTALTKYETQVASRFLPQTTYTEFYVMGEVEGLKNFFRLRCDSHAQSEIREVAEAMLELLELHQPELYKKVCP